MADSIKHLAAFFPETTYGTLPDAAWLRLPHNTIGLATAREFGRSEESTGNRFLGNMNPGNEHVAGTIAQEMAIDEEHDLLFLAAIMSPVGTPGAYNSSFELGETRKSFSMVRNFADISDKPFAVFKGLEIAKAAFSFVAGQTPKVSYEFIGREMEWQAVIPPQLSAGMPSPGATLPTRILSPFEGFLKFGIEAKNILEFSLTVENGISPDFKLFDRYTQRPPLGEAVVTGSLGMRFESASDLERVLNATETEIVLRCNARDSDYSFNMTIGRVVFTGGQPDTAKSGPINLTLPFEAMMKTDGASPVVGSLEYAV